MTDKVFRYHQSGLKWTNQSFLIYTAKLEFPRQQLIRKIYFNTWTSNHSKHTFCQIGIMIRFELTTQWPIFDLICRVIWRIVMISHNYVQSISQKNKRWPDCLISYASCIHLLQLEIDFLDDQNSFPSTFMQSTNFYKSFWEEFVHWLDIEIKT